MPSGRPPAPRRSINVVWLIGALLLLLSASGQLLSAAEQADLPVGVRRVLFLGDSITYSGEYVTDIEAYFVTRYPQRHIEFINAGLPSETICGLSEPGHADGKFPRPDLHERLGRVLALTKPDLVFACYGMNDGIYLPLDSGRFEKFKEANAWLHGKVTESGARIIHVTPPVFDEVKGGHPGYRAVLESYSHWLVERREKGWQVVDIQTPMGAYLDSRRKRDPRFAFAGDGVHPNAQGHWIMAREILLHVGARDVAQAQTAAEMLSRNPDGAALLKLVGARQEMMKDAWLTAAGHNRPGMKRGLPLDKALPKAAEMETEIRALAQHSSGAEASGSRASDDAPRPPLALCPDNPHYFLFRGKPAFLLGSTEHYGALMNRDFDYTRYLETLASDGMNVTRLFSGAYVEPAGAFHIEKNTMAPAAGRLLCPWARAGTEGYANGGGKFDLNQWDPAYFARLKAFVEEAAKRGIVVEIVLFCPYYDESQWAIAPLNARNNVNGIGDLPRTDANTLHNGKLLAVQDALVRKIAAELKNADNVYYEICNEPYFGGVTLDWQYHILGTLRDAEIETPRPHLVAQNIANKSQRIEKPNENISIFNFHYAAPEAVIDNAALNRVIGDDETGFKGTTDEVYRKEAWEFMLSGGAVFDHLDYSFTVGHEDGTFKFPPTQPGGGGPALRKQFKILADFLHGMDFTHAKPDPHFLHAWPAGVAVHVLSVPGKSYALYLNGRRVEDLSLDLPAGTWRIESVSTTTGGVTPSPPLTHSGGVIALKLPEYEKDIAIRIRSQAP